MRDHDVTALTGRELEQARRELAASLALARPDSPVRAPILAPSRITEASARVIVVGTTTAGLCITSATVREAVTMSV